MYEGQVVGEHCRDNDLPVNVCREKKLTNVRAAGSDETVRLVPHHSLSLDQALEFIREDECVEVTPDGLRLRKVVLSISWLLVKGFFWRMREKYVIRDFHPLVFFYGLGFLMTLLGLGLGIAEVVLRIMGNAVSVGTVVLVALLLIFGSQFTLFAMWFDMESNKDLH